MIVVRVVKGFSKEQYERICRTPAEKKEIALLTKDNVIDVNIVVIRNVYKWE